MIRSQHTQNTLDEYLESVKNRVINGNTPPSGIFLELCHFAALYKTSRLQPPAEPGGTRNENHLLLQTLDELRAEVTAIPLKGSDAHIITNKARIQNKLEQLAAELSRTAR